MDTGLKDRVAVVAAASAGLGYAVADKLAAEGARLCICSRDRGRIDAAAAQLRKSHGVSVFAQATDVGDPAAVAKFVADAAAQFGRIDVCVTNAGGAPSKSFAAATVEEWRSAVELNLLSHVYFAQAVLPHMQRARWGRFIMIASLTVKQPIDGLVLSNAVRGAVPGLTRSLANEYGPFNVLVNNVCPGYTLTERLNELAKARAGAQGITPEAAYKTWSASTALQRLAQPGEFADAVVYLASERASYITGQTLLVDGGFYKGAL